MTRLPDGVRSSGQRRMVTSRRGDLVIVLTDTHVTMKPKGARTNGVVSVSWGAIYERAIVAELAEQRRAAKKARKR